MKAYHVMIATLIGICTRMGGADECARIKFNPSAGTVVFSYQPQAPYVQSGDVADAIDTY